MSENNKDQSDTKPEAAPAGVDADYRQTMGDIDAKTTELLTFLKDDRFHKYVDLQAGITHTTWSAIYQSMWSCGGVVIGGIVAGPVGGLVGGMCGSLTGFGVTRNYRGVILSISKLGIDRRKELLSDVSAVLLKAGGSAVDLTEESGSNGLKNVLADFASSPVVHKLVMETCKQFLKKATVDAVGMM